jgi:hypothetical protein
MPKAAHSWPRATEDFYSEGQELSRALFTVETIEGPVDDRCCGLGSIVLAAREAGYSARGADIVDRGFPGTKVQDFFHTNVAGKSTVMNPPYTIAREFVQHALQIGYQKIAILYPIARLCPVDADWIYTAPLKTVWAIGPRPSILPGKNVLAGEKAKSGRYDYAWLVFQAGRIGRGDIAHLIIPKQRRGSLALPADRPTT